MKKQLILAAAFSSVLFQPIAFAGDGFVESYVGNPYGEVYKNSFGECWRSRFEDTTEKLEECGYEKSMVVVEQEMVIAPTAATVTTTIAEEINIRAAMLFDFDSAALSDDAKAVLDERISKYKGRGELTSNVSVVGHTDSTGPEAYNQGLSERRAKAVAEYLEQHTNIVDSQIDTMGKGESEPKASNDTKEGRAINRRVVIILDGKATQ
ncbi:MAG: OmpA family protein [Gammaproteobacteria bacterium]|nr:OmpA family protein [Gammaproteobacteria bacterium]